MRYLAIDLGDKRTGLAVGTDVLRSAEPVRGVEASGDAQQLDAIGAAIEEFGPDALVLGLPMNMDGTEGDRAKAARGFADALRERFGLPVELVDERLTSADADAQMAQTGLSHGQKKQRRDALAAAAILRDFFAQSDDA